MVGFVTASPQGMNPMFLQGMEIIGNLYSVFRDTFIYAASVETSAVDVAIKVLGEVVLRPKLTSQEVYDALIGIA